MEATILFIEKKRSDSPNFVPALRKKGFQVESVASGSEGVARINALHPNLVIINAASLRSNGKRICRTLRAAMNPLPIVVILDSDQNIPDDDCATINIRLPFTARKLINHIVPYLKGNPDKLLQAGPIQLDLERKTVRCEDRESRLTPRLAALLKLLIENKGQIIAREHLFTTVWKTNYVGDTRTLDVHISWLRNAIEVNPREPVYLKTARSRGYWLDVA